MLSRFSLGLPRQRRLLGVNKVLPKMFTRKELWSSVAASLEKRVRRVVALRYALAPLDDPVLRDQERYVRAMEASDDGFWDWIVADDTIYTSPRLLEIYGFAPGTSFAAAMTLSR